MDTILRKYLWTVDLAVVGLCTLLLGRVASRTLEGALLFSVAATGAPTIRPHPPDNTKRIDGILRRNVFCSMCAAVLGERADGRRPLEPLKTMLPLRLVNVAYARPPWRASYSAAVLRDDRTGQIGAYREGDTVMGAKIAAVQRTRVYLDNEDRLEYLDLLDRVSDAPPTAVSASDPVAAEMDRGVRRTGEHAYEIQRRTLDTVLGNLNFLWHTARSLPEIRDGKAVGIRLASVRPGSPLARIGLQSGDVISAINGLELNSPEKGLEVYGKLKAVSHLSVNLERNGRRFEMSYDIR